MFDRGELLGSDEGRKRDDGTMGNVSRSSSTEAKTARLFDDVEAFLRRFLILEEVHFAVLPLWIAHTYVFEAFDNTPYLAITSAEKGSGKSTLLDVLAMLVAKPERADGITTSALVRLIDAERPTLLLDEADTAFGRGAEHVQELRGALNAGFRAGGVLRKSEKRRNQSGETWTPETFGVYCPKAIAGLGTLPGTVADRSIPIRLKPKLPHEVVESFRIRRVSEAAAPLRERLAMWATPTQEMLSDLEPAMPTALVNRAADVAEPLLAVADRAGVPWATRARDALVALLTSNREDQWSLGVQALADIRSIFSEDDVDKIATATLVHKLKNIDTGPWGEWHPFWRDQSGITDRALARLLRQYDVSSETMRIHGGSPVKGYHRGSFEEAFSRFLPSPSSNERNGGNELRDVLTTEPAVTDATPVTPPSDGRFFLRQAQWARLPSRIQCTRAHALPARGGESCEKRLRSSGADDRE